MYKCADSAANIYPIPKSFFTRSREGDRVEKGLIVVCIVLRSFVYICNINVNIITVTNTKSILCASFHPTKYHTKKK